MALIAVASTFIPKPIDTDLEKIGNGQKSVVFVYDPNLVVSNQQATEISKARKLIGEQANFLIVKIKDLKIHIVSAQLTCCFLTVMGSYLIGKWLY